MLAEPHKVRELGAFPQQGVFERPNDKANRVAASEVRFQIPRQPPLRLSALLGRR